MAKIIGIDLGTTNSCVAVMDGANAKVLENSEGARTTPSVVAFRDGGEKLVGVLARRQAVTNPKFTFSAIKRLIGRTFADPTVAKDRDLVAYEIVRGPNGDAWVKGRDKDYSPQEVSAFILQKMKETAENFLGEKVSQAVITVPAYFNDAQRQATKDAGRIAGLEVLRIINEPTAAALAYGLEKKDGKVIAVYDLGGGTFDITVLDIDNDVFEVRSTAGDTFLGGDDFDARIMDYLITAFHEQTGIDLRQDRMAMQKLKEHSEWAKIQLSEVDRIEVSIPDIARDAEGSLTLSALLTVKQLAQMTYDLVQKTFKVCDEAMQSAGFNVSDVDGVVLVGGQTKSRFIHSAVEAYFSQAVQASVNPDEVVAVGAAIHAHQLVNRKRDAVLIDVTPLTLRVGTVGGYTDVVIQKNTPIPVEQSKTFVTASDLQEKVRIRIYQGESRESEHDTLLGEFEFSGFRIAQRGEVEVVVTFDIDANGIVKVSAVERESGAQARTTVTFSQNLSEQELRQLSAPA